MTPPLTEQERAEALRISHDWLATTKTKLALGYITLLARALLDADQRITDLARDWRTCPYCAHTVEWQDSDPIEGPCAGCRRAEAAEAQLAACREALREILERPHGEIDEHDMRSIAHRALSDGGSEA